MRRRCTDHCTEEPSRSRKKLSVNNDVVASIAIKPGEILTDLRGKRWKLGKTIGTGGFGEIFLASDNIVGEVKQDSQYVAKVELHTNGPLFVEINCYLRIGRSDSINEWKSERNLPQLGMPHYVASGSHTMKGCKYRFLIIPRFEKDLERIFTSKKQKFNLKTVLTIALQLLDTLEYIHGKGYVHCDIKASNMLLQIVQQTEPKINSTGDTIIRYNGDMPLRSRRVKNLTHFLRPHVSRRRHFDYNYKCVDDNNKNGVVKSENVDYIYLLDFGLASKYLRCNGEHKEYCSDERKAHAGTLLFCSLDAHKGAQSRRSDLESLGYNMTYWLTSSLPWIDYTEPHLVHKEKQKCLTNLDEFLLHCFDKDYPKFLFDYFKYLLELDFEARPDYNLCRQLFENALKEHGHKLNSKFDFDNVDGRNQIKRNVGNKQKPKCVAYKLNRIPLTSNSPIRLELRKKRKNKKIVKLNWANILIDPEIILKQGKTRDRKLTESSDPGSNVLNLDLNQLNPTYAMLDVYNKSAERANSGCSPKHKGDCFGHIDGYTNAMMILYNRKKEREEMELEKMVANNRSNNNNATNRTSAANKRLSNRSKKANVSKTRIAKSLQDVKKENLKKSKTVPSTRSYRLRG